MTAFADIEPTLGNTIELNGVLKSGKVDDGVEVRKSIFLMPHPNTLLTLARVFEQLKDWERSIHYYERYLEFDPIDKADVQELIANMKLKLNPASYSGLPLEQPPIAESGPARRPPSRSREAKPAKQDDPRISATAVSQRLQLRLDRLAELTASPPIKQDADQLVEIAKAIEADDPQVPLAPKVDAEVLSASAAVHRQTKVKPWGYLFLLVVLGATRHLRLQNAVTDRIQCILSERSFGKQIRAVGERYFQSPGLIMMRSLTPA